MLGDKLPNNRYTYLDIVKKYNTVFVVCTALYRCTFSQCICSWPVHILVNRLSKTEIIFMHIKQLRKNFNVQCLHIFKVFIFYYYIVADINRWLAKVSLYTLLFYCLLYSIIYIGYIELHFL